MDYMEPRSFLFYFGQRLYLDERITAFHISLFTALLYIHEESGRENPIRITRRKVMHISHLYSLATYHKYMKELVRFGYIRYFPSYHPIFGSLVYFNFHGGYRIKPETVF
jgi:hypothetical protein